MHTTKNKAIPASAVFFRGMGKLLAVFGLLALLPAAGSSALAQQVADQKLPAEAEALILEALSFNPALAASAHQIEAQASRERQVRSLPDPEVNLGYFINPAEESQFLGRFSVSAMQMFPWFGTLSAAQRQQEQLTAAEGQRHLEAALDLVLEVQLGWLDLAENGQRQQLLHEELALLTQLEDWLAARHETGLARQTERIALQMERSRLQTRIRNVEDARLPLQTRLNTLLQRAPERPLNLRAEVPLRELIAGPEHITLQLLQNRPELREYTQRTQALEHAMEQNRRMGLPEFGLGFEVMGRDYGTMNMMPAMKESFYGMATVRVPLWRGKYDGRREEYRAGMQALEQNREAARLRMVARAETLQSAWREARREVSLYDEELQPAFEQLYRLQLESYAASETGFRELLQLRRDWLGARTDRLEARFRAERELARIERETASWLELVLSLE